MQRDRGIAILLATLVVLSGCSAIGSGGTATPNDGTAAETPESTPTATAADGGAATESPDGADSSGDGGATATTAATETAAGIATSTDAPATSTATATPESLPTPDGDQSLPPGVRDDGSVNETAIAISHVRATNTSSWGLTHRNGNDTSHVTHAGETTYQRDAGTVTWNRGRLTVTNQTLTGSGREVTYRKNVSLGGGDPTSLYALGIFVRLRTGNYEWAGTTEAGGTTLHELRMTDTRNGGSSLSHYTGTMLVDDRGRIHRLRGEVGENESVAQSYDYDYDWDVDAVPTPPWFDSVPRGVAEKTPDGTALNVTVTGGPAVPADTEFELRHDGNRQTVTLDEPLAPGESLYVGLRETDGERSVVVSREPLDGEDLVNLRGTQTRLSGTVTLDGTDVSLEFTVGKIDF